MRVAEFIDIIKSYSGRLAIQNKAGYESVIPIDDLADEDFITKGNQSSFIPTENEYLIAAGTAWPANLVIGVDIITPLRRPLILQTIQKPDGSGGFIDDKWTTDGANQLVDYNDDEDGNLVSIDVITTTQNTTTVDVDTLIRII